MNVTCPQCASVFRVDPAKVPERGVRARCSVCSGLIAVRRPGTTTAAPTPPPAPIAPAVVVPTPAPPAPPPPPAPEPQPEPQHVFEPAPEPAPPAAPSVPPPPPPVAPLPPPPSAPQPTPRTPAAARFSNPFLQQDPSARARRLARALISDLVVYHPEKRQRGLAEGNLKDLFGEEIRKSWEEYAEQVGEDVANTTPYFTDALNEILAEGRKMFG